MSNSIPPGPCAIDVKALLVEFDSSGQSAASFARSKGIAAWKLYHALQRRRGKARPSRPATRAEHSALLPVRVVDPQPTHPAVALELVIAGGHRVVIGPGFDAETLRRLIGALTPC